MINSTRWLSLLDKPGHLSGPSIRWTGSTAMPTPSVTNIVAGAFDGAIVLAHDIHATTVPGVTSMAVDTLQAQGL